MHPKDQKIYLLYWFLNNLQVFQTLLHFRNLFKKKGFCFLKGIVTILFNPYIL